MNVIYSRVNKAKLDEVPVEDGQIIYVRDTYELYMDINSNRTRVSDIIFLGTEQEREALSNPFQEKLYLVAETGLLYHYYNSSWTVLNSANSIKFDNTGTTLTATNIQDAIIEINNKIGDIGTILDSINGEIVE